MASIFNTRLRGSQLSDPEDLSLVQKARKELKVVKIRSSQAEIQREDQSFCSKSIKSGSAICQASSPHDEALHGQARADVGKERQQASIRMFEFHMMIFKKEGRCNLQQRFPRI